MTASGAVPHRTRLNQQVRDLSFGTDVLAPTFIVYLLSLLIVIGVLAVLEPILEETLGVPPLSAWRLFLLSLGIAAVPAFVSFAQSWTQFQERSGKVITLRATDYQDLPELSRIKPEYEEDPDRTGYGRKVIGKFELTPEEWYEWALQIKDNGDRISRRTMAFSVNGSPVFANLTERYPEYLREIERLGWVDKDNKLTGRGRRWFYDGGWLGPYDEET